MADYLSLTEAEKREMLDAIGVDSVEDLFEDVPKSLRVKKLNLPQGKSQQETYNFMRALSKRNKVYDSIFLGAGSYDHFIPSVVKSVCSRSEFVTAYTPYQAEMSQGILQAIFEYQTMICNLTGMDVSNASHYSGATAAAEGCIMSADKVKRVVTFDNINPDVMDVLSTYLTSRGIELKVLDSVDGKAVLPDDVGAMGAVYVENPNFYGLIEDTTSIAETCHANGGKLVLGMNPVAMAIMASPREQGADVAVGEAQPLGLPMSFGGPYIGYMATTSKEMRKMPGRIVGETTDSEGNRAYVLTLQAREQHIRRERATSNICSNEALCALTVSVYLASVGAEGLKEVATACTSNAHYLAKGLVEKGAKLCFNGEFFHEFVTLTEGKAEEILTALAIENILGGLMIDRDTILWCCTEKATKETMDKVLEIVGGVL
ncbi:MAG: aminomethyl-transferring glycine dehydrogenase subunit GcvPA [Clostridia bacterium]|nr:aminomethyl-transferring glycine dehydrogenase subunit GcvPA [Clostridia bacterium]